MNSAAYRLEDVASIPNLVSGAGLALVADGCTEIKTVEGVSKIAAGRGLDLLDGWVARKLDQSSDVGAAVDACADKLGMATILAAAWHENAVPRPVLRAIAARQVLNAGATALAGIRHPGYSYRTPQSGKYSMFADNVAIFSYLYSNAIEREYPEHDRTTRSLRHLGMTAFGAGTVFGAKALQTYVARVK
jgi:phosphatidylglycerophosphate synthase